MDNVSGSLKTITGRYSFIASPCITDPCLPDMAYAVLTNEEYYYITMNGHWFSDDRSWDEYTPQSNDIVTITGYLQEKKDVFGKSFHTIEVVSLKQTK
jgi:hypothetical protein